MTLGTTLDSGAEKELECIVQDALVPFATKEM